MTLSRGQPCLLIGGLRRAPVTMTFEAGSYWLDSFFHGCNIQVTGARNKMT